MSLTTHVLDLTCGRPAAGMRVTLSRVDPATESAAAIVNIVTDTDGRTDAPLLAGPDLLPGRYELTYAVGDYFASRTESADEPSYLDIVPIRFGVSTGTEHLHVALLVTPWSYTTYRGS
jgi:5-hydroxyisourate hydrolase